MLTYARAKPMEPDKLKALLLRPGGWKGEWSGPGGKGESEYVFEARGDKVVAKVIVISRGNQACKHDVTITPDFIMVDGCFDPNQTLRFDPTDQDYPLKGKSPREYEYKLKAKQP